MPMKLHEILIEIGLITSKLNVIGSTSEFIIYVQCKNKTCRTGLPLQPVGTCFFFLNYTVQKKFSVMHQEQIDRS
jgi:hypothetical protein